MKASSLLTSQEFEKLQFILKTFNGRVVKAVERKK